MQTHENQMRAAPASAAHVMDKPRYVFTPTVDITETGDEVCIVADMPGTDEKSVDVELENDVLTIRGRIRADGAQAGEGALHRKYEAGDYRRVFTLTDHIDRSRIEASVKDGVLRLKLPKAEGAKVKRIAIRKE